MTNLKEQMVHPIVHFLIGQNALELYKSKKEEEGGICTCSWKDEQREREYRETSSFYREARRWRAMRSIEEKAIGHWQPAKLKVAKRGWVRAIDDTLLPRSKGISSESKMKGAQWSSGRFNEWFKKSKNELEGRRSSLQGSVLISRGNGRFHLIWLGTLFVVKDRCN